MSGQNGIAFAPSGGGEDCLHVNETTIRTHVAHLLDKLDLRDRAQAVIVAYVAGLRDRS